jgi:hypothetical protein
LKDAIDFVANQFTAEEGRDKYLKAAKEFRMPFWGKSLHSVTAAKSIC